MLILSDNINLFMGLVFTFAIPYDVSMAKRTESPVVNGPFERTADVALPAGFPNLCRNGSSITGAAGSRLSASMLPRVKTAYLWV